MPRSSIMLFSHICYTAHMTGAEKLLLFMLGELGKHHQCTLVVPNEGVLSGKARKLGIEVIVQYYPITEALWEPDAESQAKLEQKLQAAYLHPLFDLLHIHQPDIVFAVTCVNPLPAVAAKQLGIPVVWMVTEMLRENEHTANAVAFMNIQSDMIIGISQTVVSPFIRYGLSHKVKVLYPSYDGGRITPKMNKTYRDYLRGNLKLAEHELLVAFIASDIVPQKGLEHFIYMAVILSNSVGNVRFLIVGNPTERGYFDACMNNLRYSGCANRFIVSPFASRIDMVLPAIDLLIVPSMINEGFGMIALEAMMFGKPVVAYESGGLAELLDATGNRNHLVPKGDGTTMANVAYVLASDAEYRKLTGETSRKNAESLFGIQAYRERLKNISEELEERAKPIRQQREKMRSRWPGGILVKGDSNGVFLLENGKKRPILSEQSFYSFGFRWDQIVILDHPTLHLIPSGRPIGVEHQAAEYAPGQFVAWASDGSVHLFSRGFRHRIDSNDIFRRLNYYEHDVITVPDLFFQLFEEGAPITDRLFAEGGIVDWRLYVSPEGGYFYGENQKLRPVRGQYGHYALQHFFGREVVLSDKEFPMIPIGDPLD